MYRMMDWDKARMAAMKPVLAESVRRVGASARHAGIASVWPGELFD